MDGGASPDTLQPNANPSTHALQSLRRFSFETERLVSPPFSIAICLCALDSTAQHGTARHGTVQHGTARHHKTPSPMLPLIPSNHPVNSPSSLTRVQQQSTPKSKDPDAKREARNITVSDTAHLHRRGDRTENLSSETARLHTMTNEMLRPHRVVSGMGHLHRMTSETAHFHRMVSEMVRLHKKGEETVPFHSTVSEMVHLYRMTSETA